VLVARDVEVAIAGGTPILAPVSLEVAPGSLVALMGASGSGKSTLLRVLAGISAPTSGSATWASEETASTVHALGYVPQRESVHDRLTVREAFGYAASLRLDADAEIDDRVEAVLGELDLGSRADTLIRNLSGGERRRAACGLELVGDPPVLLLDEPTSGLDAVLERRLMQLFRRLADHGRAVLVATHATASLDLCDEVIVLEQGRPAFRGSPSAARAHFGMVTDDPALPSYAPVATEREETVRSALSGVHLQSQPAAPQQRSFALELRVMAARYLRTLARDRRTFVLSLAQAPLIGLLIAVVFHPGSLNAAGASPFTAIEVVFLLMTGAIWLGVTSSCREVVKERGLVEREFDVGVRLDAYVLAKALVLFGLNFVQVLWLTLVIIGLQPLGVGPGAVGELFAIVLLTAWASTAMGLAVSCAARSVDQAAGAIPLLLMPQLLLAGGLIPLANIVYARWSYAGLASAAHIGARISAVDYGSALGYNPSFFSLNPGTAVVVLVAFIFVQLLAAIFLLMRRPPVSP
jgi:ABC-type multidrug transport system ATPase subunit